MQRSRLLLAAAVLAAGLSYLFTWYLADHAPGLTPSGEGLMAPLDDAYIFGQYARQALAGEWLHYTPGAPLSTGVSSASWLLALTALMGLGLPLTWAAWALGLGCLAWSVESLRRLSGRLFPALPEWLLPVLLLAHASSVSLYFQGMDTGLLLAALLATAEAALDPLARRRFWALGALLAFTRPEGQVAFPLLALAKAWPAGSARWRSAGLALGLAALPTLGLWALSGSPVPDSVRPKSAALKGFGLAEHASFAGRYAGQVSGRLLMGLCTPKTQVGIVGDALSGNDPSRHFPPLALFLALLGFLWALRARGQRAWWLALGAAWLATLLLLSWTLPVGWHRHRYLAPLWPLLLLGLAAKLQQLQGQDSARSKAWRAGILTLWLGFGLMQWPWFLKSTLRSAATYAAGNRQAALVLRGMGLEGPIAVEDAGLIAYYSGHPTVDLLGVTEHRLALLQSQGPAAVEAELRSWPAERRPVAALLHVGRAGSYNDLWGRNGLLKPALPMGYMDLREFNWKAKN